MIYVVHLDGIHRTSGPTSRRGHAGQMSTFLLHDTLLSSWYSPAHAINATLSACSPASPGFGAKILSWVPDSALPVVPVSASGKFERAWQEFPL